MVGSTKYKQLFESYRWRLCELKSLEAQINKVRVDNDNGVASLCSLDPESEMRLTQEYESQKAILKQIDWLVD